ncbi:tetratricopeptide repeat protein [Streptomyces radicis]|uniref:Tetratricopeptide repeat protein n=1 Tax=Streptomyces radicis TaxID=1750517 RepID=A0A3A9W6I1_9ACTN|nr:tetratricopeptide repeat protein [Streptomyces radicis]RKN04884.1 tetratricopeptide repeat protein [Streptomyces radicis]RKN25394.1 tetratricopeptide repeat protein [Streptomyces radicis]
MAGEGDGQLAERRLTRQELIRRRRRDGFVGRQGELEAFRGNLARDPSDPGFQFLYRVRGNGGVGKTSLVRQWEHMARERGALTALVADETRGPIEAMAAISDQLKRAGSPLRSFDKRLAEYRQRLHEAERGQPTEPPPGDPGAVPSPSAGSVVATQAALVGLGALPGIGALAGALDPTSVALGTDRMRSALAGRLRGHDDVRLVLDPLAALTPVFLADLAAVAREHSLLVLFFDVYERVGPTLDAWLRTVVYEETLGTLEPNVAMVISGQGRPDSGHWRDWADLAAEVPLDVFTDEEARALLTARGVTDEPTVELILRLSGRLPVLLDMLAQPHPSSPGEVADPTETAVGRFLTWVTDPDRRAAALDCALPLQLDEDVYRAVASEAAADHYDWLRALPFVEHREGRFRYHETVRALMLRHQRTHSPGHWRAQHTALAEAFAARRAAAFPEGDDWSRSHWRELRGHEAYHRLCADPDAALAGALAEAVHAADRSAAALRRWADLLRRAGDDAERSLLTMWADRLTCEDDPAEVIAALTHLIAAPGLAPPVRALAHVVRAQHHRWVDALEQAIADCSVAIRLDPAQHWAWGNRAAALAGLGRPEEALEDADEAARLAPHSLNLTLRARILFILERHEEAIAAWDRVTEVDPDDAEAPLWRALSLWHLGRYEEALTGFDRALALAPDNARALSLRAYVHEKLGRLDKAHADHDRAAELDPSDAEVLGTRASFLWRIDDLDGALAVYDRAVEADPDEASLLADRGHLRLERGEFDEAVADYDRALALAPDDWAYAGRGEARLMLGRYEEALADLAEAVEREPRNAWAHGLRGIAHRLAGRPGADEHTRAAREILFEALAGGENDAALGNLFLLACAASEWADAAGYLDRFLATEPDPSHASHVLELLGGLGRLLSLDAARLDPLARRLEGA